MRLTTAPANTATCACQSSGITRRSTLSRLTAKKDRYGRTIGKVMFDGTDACLEQIKAGLAWRYKRYVSELRPP